MASDNQNIFYRLYHLFREQFVQWAFCGEFTSEKIDLIIRFFENFLDQETIIQKIQKRAFYIFVEGIQNVHRHQLTPGNISFLRRGFLLFQQENKHIAFTMGNIIKTDQVKNISARLDELNKMSRDELNSFYKKVLKNEVLSEKGGAGLGLIEIARKSQNLLNYNFVPLEEGFSLFYLKVVVSETENIRTVRIADENIKTNTDLHQMLVESGTSLSFHAAIPFRLPEELRSKTNTIFPDSYPSWSVTMLYSVITILHRIFQNNDREQNPGYVFCQSSDSQFNIIAGIIVPRSEAGNVNALFEILKEKDCEELKQKLSKPPNIQITDISEKNQFVSMTFSFSM